MIKTFNQYKYSCSYCWKVTIQNVKIKDDMKLEKLKKEKKKDLMVMKKKAFCYYYKNKLLTTVVQAKKNSIRLQKFGPSGNGPTNHLKVFNGPIV